MVAGQFDFCLLSFQVHEIVIWSVCFFYKYKANQKSDNFTKAVMGRIFRNVFSLLILCCLCLLLWVISWSCAQLSFRASVLTPQRPLQVAMCQPPIGSGTSACGCESWWVAPAARPHKWSLRFRPNWESFYLSSALLTCPRMDNPW